MRRAILILGIGGLLFAGYLSFGKLISGTCVLGESCPNFLGYPACYYGFAMYLAIVIFAASLFLKIFSEKSNLNSILGVALLGIIFAGYFTIKEIPVLSLYGLSAYKLGLPTCAWGLIFYVLIFVLTFIERKKLTQSEPNLQGL